MSHTYTLTHIHMRTRIYTHAHAYTLTDTHINTRTHIHIHIYTCTHIPSHTHTRVCAHMQMCMECTHTHTRTEHTLGLAGSRPGAEPLTPRPLTPGPLSLAKHILQEATPGKTRRPSPARGCSPWRGPRWRSGTSLSPETEFPFRSFLHPPGDLVSRHQRQPRAALKPL